MKLLLRIALIVVMVSNNSYSQKEYNNWYFGNHAAITFNTSDGSPTALTDCAMHQFEGCASISDTDGRLLFYTDGDTVFNRNHTNMPNGYGLLGGSSSSQSALIVPKPGPGRIYYVFTTTERENRDSPNAGAHYSVVDMSLDNGLGDVKTKNIPVFNPSTEKITLAYHRNCNDIWVIYHEWNSKNFRAYLVTENGLEQDPVISAAGSDHSDNDFNIQGCMKASRQGDRIALILPGIKLIQIFDFDNQTGIVSNPRDFIPDSGDIGFGLEFSPDGTKLYAETRKVFGERGFLYQIDLNKDLSKHDESATIINKKSIIFGQMQSAPDKKIYIAYFDSTFLGCIDKPDLPGNGCGFIMNSVGLKGKKNTVGLPNFTMPANYMTRLLVLMPDTVVKIRKRMTIPFGIISNSYEKYNRSTDFEAEIRFEASAYLPLDPPLPGVRDMGIVDGDRVINISGKLPGLTYGYNELPGINGRVLFANQDTTPLRIVKFTTTDTSLQIQKKDGSLILQPICQKNISHVRLINRISLLVSPNPAVEKARIIIECDYTGNVELFVYSCHGALKLRSAFRKDGPSAAYDIDIIDLPSGVYQVIARFDGSVVSKPMIVVK